MSRVPWRKLALPVLLIAANIASLVFELTHYVPHGDVGLMTELLACASVVCGMICGIRALRRGDRVRATGCAVLLLTCAVCGWMAAQIPFCPLCDGGGSPLMQWLFPEWFQP